MIFMLFHQDNRHNMKIYVMLQYFHCLLPDIETGNNTAAQCTDN